MAATNKNWTDFAGPTLNAVDLNGFKLENNNLIIGSGQGINTSENQQTQIAVSTYAAGGDFYTDGGVADAYVLSIVGAKLAPIGYFDGMRIRALAGNTNTGPSTINADGLGVVVVVDKAGVALVGGEIVADQELSATYNSGAGNFRLQTITGLGTAANRDVGLNSGNVMEVGAFGLGATNPTPFVGDLDTIVQTSFVAVESAGSSNLPVSEDGFLITNARDANNVVQFFSSLNSDVNFTRRREASLWVAWSQLLNATSVGSAAFEDIGVGPGNLVIASNFDQICVTTATTAALSGLAGGAGPGDITLTLDTSNLTADTPTEIALDTIPFYDDSEGADNKVTVSDLLSTDSPGKDYTSTLQVTTGNFNVTNGEITASGDITAGSSDGRLKDIVKQIDPANALDFVCGMNAVFFTWNINAKKHNDVFSDDHLEIGFISQDFEKLFPEVIKPAPFDTDKSGYSITGENYKTIAYEKTPVILAAAIKELFNELCELKDETSKIRSYLKI